MKGFDMIKLGCRQRTLKTPYIKTFTSLL